MGRLYRKFFIFFFLSQLTSVIGVGLTFWWQADHSRINTVIDRSPPARALVDSASATLEFGGVPALKKLLEHWHNQPMPQLYAVDKSGRELMQRELPEATLKSVTQIEQSQDAESYLRKVKMPDGQEYLLFVAENQYHPNRPPGFDQFEGEGGVPPPPPSNFLAGDDHMPPPMQSYDPDFWNGPLSHFFGFPIKQLFYATLVSLIYAALLAWYVSKPIKSLGSAFQKITNGELNIRVSDAMSSRNDELSDLGRHFDLMVSRLLSLMHGQSRLLHHVSHELRTPLARIQMAIGLELQNTDKPSYPLSRIQYETEHMDRLVGELLQLSKLESGTITLRKEDVLLNDILSGVVEDALLEAQIKHIEIQLHSTQDFVLNGEPELLHRAIENVLRNAIKYSPEKSEIVIEAHQQERARLISITILDQGPGVAEFELESIFEPFIRSRNVLNTDGHGLGLAITRQIIEAHAGTIIARNRSGGGLQVEMTIPYHVRSSL
ncbi:MAG TPA: ATP-binding protein [Methyloradius sp.]